MEYRWVNPAAVKQQRVPLTNGRARKGEPLDLWALAHCLREGLGQAPLLHTSGVELRFQVWADVYQQTQRAQHHLALAVLQQLDRLWPGALVNVKRFRARPPTLAVPEPLVRSTPLARALVRAIIQHAPNPSAWLALTTTQIQAFFRTHVGRCGPTTAARVAAVVANARLPPPELAALLAERLHSDFQPYLALEGRLPQLAAQAQALVPGSPAAVLTTVPGLSPFLAARSLAHLGPPRRFDHAGQVWAFAGFDPAGKPVHLMQRINDEPYSIVAQYQTEYRGVVHYYRLAYNLHQLRACLENHLTGMTTIHKIWDIPMDECERN